MTYFRHYDFSEFVFEAQLRKQVRQNSTSAAATDTDADAVAAEKIKNESHLKKKKKKKWRNFTTTNFSVWVFFQWGSFFHSFYRWQHYCSVLAAFTELTHGAKHWFLEIKKQKQHIQVFGLSQVSATFTGRKTCRVYVLSS